MLSLIVRSLMGLWVAVVFAACPAGSSVEDASQKGQEKLRQQPVAKVTSQKTKGKIILVWEAHPLAEKYELQRSITPNVAQARDLMRAGAYRKMNQTWETIATITATEYTDTLDIAGTYQYRVRAVFEGGDVSPWAMVAEITVADEDLTVPETAPAAPTNLVATAPASARVELTWKDNADNESGFRLERKTGSGTFAKVADIAKNTQSYDDTGLMPATSYAYRIVAVNAAGDSDPSNEANVTTPEAPPIIDPPAAPSALHAVAVESGSVQIAWTDNASDETGFKVMRKVGASGTYVAIATLSANTQQLTDNAVAPLTQYFYKVLAYNTGGNSPASNEIQVDTPTDVLAPAAPTWSSATAISATQIGVAWTDNANNEDGYKIERKLGAGGTYVQIATLAANAHSYDDSGLVAETQYFYRIYAFNAGGSSALVETYATTQAATPGEVAPQAPAGLVATAVSASRIDLVWDDNSDNESGFKVERRSGAGAFSVVATLGAGAVGYSDTGLDASTQYVYRVYAFNGAGNSANSNEHGATTEAASATAPDAPTGLEAWVNSAGAIGLYWNDNAVDEAGYRVFRATGAAEFELIAELAADETSYYDSGLVADTTYRYLVKAFNGAGESASSQVTATTNSANCTETWSETSYIGAGSDGVWGTSDDAVGFYAERRYDGYGNDVYATHRAYDETGLLLDGETTKRIYTLAGLLSREETYNAPGPDGDWDTADDVLSSLRTFSYDESGQMSDETYAHYADGVIAYGSRYVYAHTAAQSEVMTETWEYDQPGTDAVFGTADDRLYRYSSHTFAPDHNSSTNIVYVGDVYMSPYGERTINEFDSTHAQTIYQSAGADLVFGTSDDADVMKRASYLVDGLPSHTIVTLPGFDTLLGTEDDTVGGYTRYTVTGGRITLEVISESAGADEAWGTADDDIFRTVNYAYDVTGHEIRNEVFEFNAGIVMFAELRRAQYDADGNEIFSYVSNDPGVDGVFETSDDGDSMKTTRTFVAGVEVESRTEEKSGGNTSYTRTLYTTPEGSLGSYEYYTDRGADSTWGTADDILAQWFETSSNASGYATSMFTGLGDDGVRGTGDDLWSYKYGSILDEFGRESKSWWLYSADGTVEGSVIEYVYGEFGALMGERKYGPGPDGLYLTGDDVVVEYTHREYDSNGVFLYEQLSTAPGADTVWGTGDDTITGREVEAYESACNP